MDRIKKRRARKKPAPRFKNPVVDGLRRCPTCEQWKPVDVFGFRKTLGKIYTKPRCPPCAAIVSKKWSKNNAKKRYSIYRKWVVKNKVKLAEWARNHRIKNGDKIRSYSTARNKIRRATDPEYKIRCILRGRISSALRGKGKKAFKAMELLGCTIPELKAHIEKQFLPGMSWENHGSLSWHVDHRTPCASFDLTKPKEQKKCFHYTNLQPLWWIDNIRKGDKILDSL